MGRYKTKIEAIQEANKRILGESMIDIDKVLRDMKYKFGYGDLAHGWIEEFEDDMGDVIEVLSTNEYTDLFSDWMKSKSISHSDGPDVEYGDEEDERRYDDRENYGIDDESRYDERNYKYGNHPDDD